MILSILNDFLQFLIVVAGFFLSILSGLAPFMMIVLIGKAIRGDEDEQDR